MNIDRYNTFLHAKLRQLVAGVEIMMFWEGPEQEKKFGSLVSFWEGHSRHKSSTEKNKER